MTTDETTTTTDAGRAPIYVSYPTFTTFLDWLKEMEVIPSQIDRSLWGAKFSGSNGTQLLGGLRFLGLLVGEAPTELLRDLANADNDGRKEIMRDILRATYGESIVDHLNSMTPKLLDAKFDEMGATSATHRKAVSFFVNAAKTADIKMQPAIRKRARNRPHGAGSRKTDNGAKPKVNDPPPALKQREDSTDLQTRYIEMLMTKIDESDDLDGALLNRIEALLGFEPATVDQATE